MKIHVYLAFLIARLQISKFNKKLHRQSKLLPVANKFNKIRYKSSFNDRAFSFMLAFLVFFCWFFARFVLHWRCFKPNSERARYIKVINNGSACSTASSALKFFFLLETTLSCSKTVLSNLNHCLLRLDNSHKQHFSLPCISTDSEHV